MARRGCGPQRRSGLTWLMRPSRRPRLPRSLSGGNRIPASNFRRVAARSTGREKLRLFARSRTATSTFGESRLESARTKRWCARSDSNRGAPLRRRQPESVRTSAWSPERESNSRASFCRRRVAQLSGHWSGRGESNPHVETGNLAPSPSGRPHRAPSENRTHSRLLGRQRPHLEDGRVEPAAWIEHAHGRYKPPSPPRQTGMEPPEGLEPSQRPYRGRCLPEDGGIVEVRGVEPLTRPLARRRRSPLHTPMAG